MSSLEECLSYDEIVELISDSDDMKTPWSPAQDRKIIAALKELRQWREDERVAETLISAAMSVPNVAESSKERVSDSDLEAAIEAFQVAIDATASIPPGLADCDRIALRAMRELTELRAHETTDEPVVTCETCIEAHRTLSHAGIADGELIEKIEDLITERDEAVALAATWHESCTGKHGSQVPCVSSEKSAERCEARSPGYFVKQCDLQKGHEGSHDATQGGVRDKWPAEKSNSPLPPDVLASALQDVVHKDLGPVRAAHAVKTSESQKSREELEREIFNIVHRGGLSEKSAEQPEPLAGVDFLHAWMRSPNPSLGGIVPLDLLKHGKGQKIAQFIEAAYEAGQAPAERCNQCEQPLPPVLEWSTPTCPTCTEEASVWHPIETAPKSRKCLFYVISKPADECFTDTNGNPICSNREPSIELTQFGCWSSLRKATHWAPIPLPPVNGSESR